jgi:hypothetical protein
MEPALSKESFTAMSKEQVLNIFKNLYGPGEARRIEHFFSMQAPESLETGKNLGLPAFDKACPARLLVIMGIGSIHFLDKLVKNKAVQDDVRRIIIVENDPAVITHLINDPQFTNFLIHPMFRFIFGVDADNFKTCLFSILKQPDYSKLMRVVQIFVNDSLPPEMVKVYDQCKSTYDEVIFHVFHNYGRIDDSLEGVRSTLANRPYIEDCPGIEDLKDKYKGIPAAIIAAGPSLDYAIESGKLKELHKKCVFIAADAAVKPLLKAGIEPEYTTSIERGNIYQIPFWKDLPPINTELVFFPVLHPDVLKLYPGPKRVVYRNYSYYAYFQNSWPKGLIGCGGSTTHLAFKLAFYMGCSDVILIGKDNAYEKREDGLYRSHCNNLGHEEWAGYHSIEYFNREKNHAPAYEVKAFDGTNVMTNVTYHQWAKEMAEMTVGLELSGKIYATNPKAVAIPGVDLESLETIVSSLEEVKKPEVIRPRPYYHRSWDHKHLLKSVKGWLRFAKAMHEKIKESIYAGVTDLAYPSSYYQKIYQNGSTFLEIKQLCTNTS